MTLRILETGISLNAAETGATGATGGDDFGRATGVGWWFLTSDKRILELGPEPLILERAMLDLRAKAFAAGLAKTLFAIFPMSDAVLAVFSDALVAAAVFSDALVAAVFSDALVAAVFSASWDQSLNLST
jgi:hypothetical protein